MALSVAQFAQVADWFNNTNPISITGLAWTAGDTIVVLGGTEIQTSTPAVTPTNANLTFGAANASSTSGTSSECGIWLYATTAGSSQTGQSISLTRSAGVQYFGGAAWVITGSPSGAANASAALTESAFTVSPTAGSVVIYAHMDFAAAAAGRTGTTASGSYTERRDASNTTNYAQYAGDWVGVSAGSQSFGVTSYTSLTVARAVIEILAPVAGGSSVMSKLSQMLS